MSRLLQIPAVAELLGVSRTTVWRIRCADPTFPVAIRLAGTTVAFF